MNPFWTCELFIGIELWFSLTVYQSCILCFPFIHRLLHDKAKRGRKVLYLTHGSLQAIHFATLVFMESIYLTLKSKEQLEAANYFIWAGKEFQCMNFLFSIASFSPHTSHIIRIHVPSGTILNMKHRVMRD